MKLYYFRAQAATEGHKCHTCCVGSGHRDTEIRRWRARKCFGLGLVCSCLMVFKEAGWHAVLTPPIGIQWEFLLIFTASGACIDAFPWGAWPRDAAVDTHK